MDIQAKAKELVEGYKAQLIAKTGFCYPSMNGLKWYIGGEMGAESSYNEINEVYRAAEKILWKGLDA